MRLLSVLFLRLLFCFSTAVNSDSYSMCEFQATTTLKCTASSLRDFLGRPMNLPRVSDPELQLEIIKAPELVTVGERIEFRITAYGFKQRAIHVYVAANELEIIEDQIEGPLKAWRHRQVFTCLGDGQAVLEDQIRFTPPGGMLGFMMTEQRIRESLQEGIQARHDALADLVRSGIIQ